MEIIGWIVMAVCVVVMMAAILHRAKEQYPDEPNTSVTGGAEGATSDE